MGKVFQAVRGMNDILPEETAYWQHLESILQAVTRAYHYRQIRLPLLESSALFKRSIGEITDIVEKEMYTFADRNGDYLTLRPEGTAGCVRAAIEHGLLHNQVQRLWYCGPMFRHERPQKGRYRQFFQFGAEAYGMSGPDIDAEIILMSSRLLAQLGLSDTVVLQLNSLGTQTARANYREKLVQYFITRQAELDEDSQRRLHSNPLRILDSKNPAMQDVIAQAPKMVDNLDSDSKRHFEQLTDYLTSANQAFVINPSLVRGLDYYGLTVFEWVTSRLGAQATVCAGGRYDALVALLGGKQTPAVGFAAGLDRLVLLMKVLVQHEQRPDIWIVLSDKTIASGLLLAEKLRTAFPVLAIESNFTKSSFKSQLKQAFKSGARWALIIGEEEQQHAAVTIKNLRDDKEQDRVPYDQLINWFTLKEEKCYGKCSG